jgi:hypothetical protein
LPPFFGCFFVAGFFAFADLSFCGAGSAAGSAGWAAADAISSASISSTVGSADFRLAGKARVSSYAEVEVHLARMFGLELAGFEVDHHERSQLKVVEQQVDVEVSVANLQIMLSAHKCEALPQFQ